MNIPWKLKSSIFSFIDAFHAEGFLYFLQKYVTKRSSSPLVAINELWKLHERSISKYNIGGSLFEFGAGKNLVQNLYLSKYFDKQIVVDLNPMLDFELTDQACKFLADNLDDFPYYAIQSIEDLNRNYRIQYQAPFDARKTDLEDNSIDVCVSTNTLEHIPPSSIREIFTEVKRILKNNGHISAVIDYTDHYSHTDKTISIGNFLQFSDSEWEKYNHDCHYQNRLRHDDFLHLFEELGYVIVESTPFQEQYKAPSRIDSKFQNSDIQSTSGYFLLKKISDKH